MKAGSTPGAEKPMVKLRLSIEPASAAGSERRGTLAIQVGVLRLGHCIVTVLPQHWACPGSWEQV